MKLKDLSKLTEKMEEVSAKLKNWGLEVTLEFETFENNLVVILPNDSEHLLFDLLELENSRRVDNNVWLEIKNESI